MFSINRLQELMKPVPRGTVDTLARQCAADKHSKGFRTWDQLVMMVYGHLAGAHSLRTLDAGFNRNASHHYHLGTRAVRRSTLADANGKRSPAVFEAIAERLMAQVGRSIRREGREFLQLLDSTTITLKGRYYGWTAGTRTRCGEGVKLHLTWDAHTAAPVRQAITATNVNDRDVAVQWPIQEGVTYVFDKGYCDYTWWHRITQKGARFVTRFKINAALDVAKSRRIPKADRATILSDEIVTFQHKHARGGRPATPEQTLRRITVARKDDAPLVLATNDLKRPAAQIAQLYRARWGIELFFKWMKQHLKIKRFLGHSPNAVRIQILCALIAYLLLALYRTAQGLTDSLWIILAGLSQSLFQRPQTQAAAYRRRCERLADIAARQGVLNV